jgi:hypothetical protein
MRSSTLWNVPEPALIPRLAEHFQSRQITRIPDWLWGLFPDSQRDQLTSWWYHQAAYNLYHFARTPMLRPHRPPSMKGNAIESLMTQFAALGWLSFDRTGIMLVSKDFDELVSELVGRNSQ